MSLIGTLLSGFFSGASNQVFRGYRPNLNLLTGQQSADRTMQDIKRFFAVSMEYHAPVGHNGIRSAELTTQLPIAFRKDIFPAPAPSYDQKCCFGSDDHEGSGGDLAPKGFVRHSDGHLSPNLGSSEYSMALESLTQYVLHASYTIDAWRGKPKGSTMEIIKEGVKAQEYQYEALAHIAKGLANTIKSNGLTFEYNVPDPLMPDYGNGDPDFNQLGWAAAESTLKAIEMTCDPNPNTVSLVEAATQ